jgi:hypothetical protein
VAPDRDGWSRLAAAELLEKVAVYAQLFNEQTRKLLPGEPHTGRVAGSLATIPRS